MKRVYEAEKIVRLKAEFAEWEERVKQRKLGSWAVEEPEAKPE